MDLLNLDELLVTALPDDPPVRAVKDTPLASWLRQERAVLRLSQQDLANGIGKSRSWVASIERGDFRPRFEDARRIAWTFGVEPEVVLRLAGYPDEEIKPGES